MHCLGLFSCVWSEGALGYHKPTIFRYCVCFDKPPGSCDLPQVCGVTGGATKYATHKPLLLPPPPPRGYEEWCEVMWSAVLRLCGREANRYGTAVHNVMVHASFMLSPDVCSLFSFDRGTIRRVTQTQRTSCSKNRDLCWRSVFGRELENHSWGDRFVGMRQEEPEGLLGGRVHVGIVGV